MIWVKRLYRGLPVFRDELAFHFDPVGRLKRDKTGKPTDRCGRSETRMDQTKGGQTMISPTSSRVLIERQRARARQVHGTSTIWLFLLVLLAWPPVTVAVDNCSKRLCQSGETYRAETEPGAAYGWCHREVFTYGSHQRRECEAGWTLERVTGLCVKSGCCPEMQLCASGNRYARSGTSGGRTYGVCEHSSGGYISHQLVYCEDGWQLDTARGVCRKLGCAVTVNTGVVAPAPGYVIQPAKPGNKPAGRPDLVVRKFALKHWGVCQPGRVVMTFSVTVANIGSAASPLISGKALVRVSDGHGNGWGNGAALPAIAAGASTAVEVPVYFPRSERDHVAGGIPHPFRATADPLRLVTESDEANNDSAVLNIGAPTGCVTATKH